MNMIGNDRIAIILAGGSGSRIMPITKAYSKHLLPVYNKPMIFYSMSTLIRLGHKKIIIITNPEHKENYFNLFKNGEDLGIIIDYVIQNQPNGIAEAFLLCKKWIKNKKTTLILGDNIFFSKFENIVIKNNSATVVTSNVNNPYDYGVVERSNKKIKIIEKPKTTKSKEIVTGLYFYDHKVLEYAKQLKPSSRGELEISDINNKYLNEKKLYFYEMKSIDTWFDAGNFDTLLDVSYFIKSVEGKRNLIFGCPYQSAHDQKLISNRKFDKIKKILKYY
ncbi:sugar phosphate nucleotidyltransferase [Pelagibacteraceae bacterium]|jgi:glucose-1-phosphate thymidylyltransferase|nr:sugar phosphate nucleotidyltransferase [Pelagibacteraceae bacterium]